MTVVSLGMAYRLSACDCLGRRRSRAVRERRWRAISSKNYLAGESWKTLASVTASVASFGGKWELRTPHDTTPLPPYAVTNFRP